MHDSLNCVEENATDSWRARTVLRTFFKEPECVTHSTLLLCAPQPIITFPPLLSMHSRKHYTSVRMLRVPVAHSLLEHIFNSIMFHGYRIFYASHATYRVQSPVPTFFFIFSVVPFQLK